MPVPRRSRARRRHGGSARRSGRARAPRRRHRCPRPRRRRGSPCRCARTGIRAGTPGRAYLTALPTRLAKSWRTATSSACTAGRPSSATSITSSGRSRASAPDERAVGTAERRRSRDLDGTSVGHGLRRGGRRSGRPSAPCLARRGGPTSRTSLSGARSSAAKVEPGADRGERPAQVVAAVEAKPTSGRMPSRCSVTSAEHEQDAGAAVVASLAGERGPRHGEHELVAGGQRQRDVADAELGARGTGVGGRPG